MRAPDAAGDRTSARAAYRRGPWLLLPYLAAGIAVAALPTVLDRTGSLHSWYRAAAVAVPLAGLVPGLAAAVHPRLDRATRRAWRWLSGYFALLALHAALAGPAAAHGGRLSGGLSAALVVAVAVRALAAPVLVAGLLSFAATPRDRRARWKIAMDVVTVIGGGIIGLWYLVLGPTLTGGRPLAGPGAAATLAYAAGDLVLVGGICTVLLRGAVAAARRVLPLLLAGATVTLFGELVLAYSAAHRPGPPGAALLLAGLCGTALMTFAAAEQLRTAAVPHAGDRRRSLRRVNALPYVALGAGYALLGVAAVDAGVFPWGGLVAGAALMTFGVAARQVVALRENHALVVTDGLTGLANRLRLHDALERAAARSRRSGAAVAALAFDLDGFKQVNDSYGHEAGDALLTEFADVLRRHIRPTDVSARLGGDEFAVLLENVTEADAVTVAERILNTLTEPVTIAGEPVRIRASVGIAVSDPAAGPLDPRELLHRADIAMYAAKRQRTNSWRLYSDEAMRVDRDAAALRDDLLRAVTDNQLRLLYQPIVALDTGALVAVEALVRWNHPTRGEVSPVVFIPIAEELGVIDDIGAWVLEEACRQVRSWQDRLAPGRPLYLSVNFSAHQLQRPDLAEEVLTVLERTGLHPRDLVLEITESAVVDDNSAIPQLDALRARGVRVALDDFGTGYSSLRYLTRLPVDILKLDRCFVAELNGDPEGSAVAEAVIRLSQILHLDTVAEGIEDPAQATELTLLGCRNAQGFHFARPLPAESLDALLDGGDVALPTLPTAGLRPGR